MNQTDYRYPKQHIFKDYNDVLTVKNVQDIMGISRHQVYHLINSGKVRGIKVGKAYKIPKIKLIEFFLNENHHE